MPRKHESDTTSSRARRQCPSSFPLVSLPRRHSFRSLFRSIAVCLSLLSSFHLPIHTSFLLFPGLGPPYDGGSTHLSTLPAATAFRYDDEDLRARASLNQRCFISRSAEWRYVHLASWLKKFSKHRRRYSDFSSSPRSATKTEARERFLESGAARRGAVGSRVYMTDSGAIESDLERFQKTFSRSPTYKASLSPRKRRAARHETSYDD